MDEEYHAFTFFVIHFHFFDPDFTLSSFFHFPFLQIWVGNDPFTFVGVHFLFFSFLQILVTIISLVSLFSFHFSFFTNLGGSVTDHIFNFSPITYSFLQIRVDVMTLLSLVKPFHPHFFFCTNQSGRGDPAFTFCLLFTLPFFPVNSLC